MRPSRCSASDPAFHESGAIAPVAPVQAFEAGSYTASLLSSVGSPPAPGESTATIVAYSRFPKGSYARASLHTRCPATVVDARAAHELATGSYAYRRGPFPA